MKTVFHIAAIVAATLATAAPAAAQKVHVASIPPAAASVGAARTALDADRKRYCVRVEGVGTRLGRNICQTRAEWLREGFDPVTADTRR